MSYLNEVKEQELRWEIREKELVWLASSTPHSHFTVFLHPRQKFMLGLLILATLVYLLLSLPMMKANGVWFTCLWVTLGNFARKVETDIITQLWALSKVAEMM